MASSVPWFLSLFMATLVSLHSSIASKYILVPHFLSWDKASTHCSNTYGTSLASIHSFDDNTEASNLCQTNCSGCANFLISCSIGLNDKGNEQDLSRDAWSWEDGSVYDFQNWRDNEPTATDKWTDCGVIFPADHPQPNYIGKWADVDCTDYEFYALCNNPLTSAPSSSPTKTTLDQTESSTVWSTETQTVTPTTNNPMNHTAVVTIDNPTDISTSFRPNDLTDAPTDISLFDTTNPPMKDPTNFATEYSTGRTVNGKITTTFGIENKPMESSNGFILMAIILSVVVIICAAILLIRTIVRIYKSFVNKETDVSNIANEVEVNKANDMMQPNMAREGGNDEGIEIETVDHNEVNVNGDDPVISEVAEPTNNIMPPLSADENEGDSEDDDDVLIGIDTLQTQH